MAEVIAHQPIELGQPALRYRSQCPAQFEDRGISKRVMHELPPLAGFHERRPPQRLEMLRDIGNRYAQLARQGVYRALALGEELEHFEAMRAAQCLAHAGELGVQAALERAMGVGAHVHIFNRILEYWPSSDQSGTRSARPRSVLTRPTRAITINAIRIGNATRSGIQPSGSVACSQSARCPKNAPNSRLNMKAHAIVWKSRRCTTPTATSRAAAVQS